MNIFDEMRRAVSEAQATLRAADNIADSMARLLVGRLRHVSSTYILVKLKKELRDFNAHTGRWKDVE